MDKNKLKMIMEEKHDPREIAKNKQTLILAFVYKG